MTAPRIRIALALAALAALLGFGLGGRDAAAGETTAPVASGWTLVKFPQPQPACTGVGFRGVTHYSRLDCGFGYVSVSGTTLAVAGRSTVKVAFIDRNGAVLQTAVATARTTAGSEGWQFTIQPASTWPAGDVTIRVTDVDPDGAGPAANLSGNFGETGIVLNALGARIAPGPGDHRPGDSVPFTGAVYELMHPSALTNPEEVAVAATVSVQLRTAAGEVRGPYGPFTADAQGRFSGTLPAAATAGITATAETGFKTTASIEVVNAVYDDPASGRWEGARAGAGALPLFVQPNTLLLENAFVSDVGWVKPGESYPFRVFVRNYTGAAATGASVTIPAPNGTTFTRAAPATGSGSASISGGTITWSPGTVPAAIDGVPGLKTLIVEARASTLGQDPQIVWKNLSSTATLTYTGGPTLRSTSEGPKVIPPKATFDTARYGYRPFAVVAADWFDRKHEAAHTSESLREKLNSPDIEGSTFNLFQENSYGQLFPHGTVPSAGIATAGWDVAWSSDRFKTNGFAFTEPAPSGACTGTSFKALKGSSLYSERIVNGWYQLPGDTGYYGSDKDSFANVAKPDPSFIDNACGPIGKAVYDAALIADPEIDYSDYDTDKDGVVDFFMLVFAGIGGNGASQTSVPPYDNVWPHSSTLEGQFTDPATGLKGYISDDQLKDLEGRLMYYTDASRTQMTPAQTPYPVYVRVGPYNVNPEAAIDKASVISHEYGHSLGLPDYYSSGSRETYGDWNLLATDKSQNLDVNGKQELGWLVPRVLAPGQTTVSNWQDSKTNTHRIDWMQPDGTPYTLSGPTVSNGEAYVAKLPGRRILDPARVPSGSHVYYSDSGNDFGCPPDATGRNLDISIPALADLPAGTPVTLRFKSLWSIEWDYDYGFVMAASRGSDGSVSYTSLPSTKGFTTPQSTNPNAIGCQLQYGNGITGTTASHVAGTQTVDRLSAVNAYPDGPFATDEYDLTPYTGGTTRAIRFAYVTDGGLAKPGWFIDDIEVVTGDGTVLYSSDFEAADDPAIYNGGCRADFSTASQCSAGWRRLDAAATSDADHGYYLEMRDRSGFDFDGRGQIDRSPLAFSPGMLLVYTDEATGYGNTGQGDGDRPNQSPLDSQPQAGNIAPVLDDAAFTAAAGKNAFSDSISAARPEGWIDNYKDATTPYADGNWHLDFGCLTFEVLRMAGTGIGPATGPGDLNGDVSFTLGTGCGAYDYGFGVANAAPTAVAQAKPTEASTGEPIALDGTGSFDDRDSADKLSYSWDVDGDGTFDKTGPSVVHTYGRPGIYRVTLKVTDPQGLSDTDEVIVTIVGPDLRVTGLTTSSAREGRNVTVTATVFNNGPAKAPASKTQFLLDGTTVLGLVDTPALNPGTSTLVSVVWNTKGVKGEHVLKATADQPDTIGETDETNNAASLTVTVKGNKVKNGSFEDGRPGGGHPQDWDESGSPGGSTTYGDDGVEGSKAAGVKGSGGSAATGSPAWTSAPVAVVPGEVLDLTVSVKATGASSPATASLVYLGPLGNVLQTVTALTAPLTTAGFRTLEQTVTVPIGVAQVRVVLNGFAPSDLATAGTVVFDDVGLFEH